MSPLVPAILFTTDEKTEVPLVTANIGSAEFTAAAVTGSITPGGTYDVAANLTVPVTVTPPEAAGTFISLETLNMIHETPDAFVWEVIGFNDTDNAIADAQPNTRTRVTKHGVLHLQKTMPASVGGGHALWSELSSVAVNIRSTYSDQQIIVNIPIAFGD